jgi:hypothetical protein
MTESVFSKVYSYREREGNNPKENFLIEIFAAKKQIDLDEFKISFPEQRYLNILQSRPDLIQHIPQHQLASYLGIRPQSLNRLRARILEKSKE